MPMPMYGASYQDFLPYATAYVDPDGLDSMPDDGACPSCGATIEIVWDTQATDPYPVEEITNVHCTACRWEL